MEGEINLVIKKVATAGQTRPNLPKVRTPKIPSFEITITSAEQEESEA